MRSLLARTLAVVALFGVGAAVVGACHHDKCDILPCGPIGGGGGDDGGGGSGVGGEGAQGGGGQGGDGGGGAPPECDPHTTDVVGDDCGLFVDTAASGAETGTKSEPFHSLNAALAVASPGEGIYVCTSPLAEAVVVDAAARIYGGLDCATWAPTDVKTSWTASANEVPLRVGSNANGTLIYTFAITSAAATGFDASTLQGNSSIAAVVDTAQVTFENVDLAAGAGAPGGDGMNQGGQAEGRQSNAPAFDGNMGGACGMPAGTDKLFTCGGVQTIGGAGGNGGLNTGGGAFGGSPDPGLGEPDGTAGLGDTGLGGWTCAVNGGDGQTGHPGPDGNPGPGGSAIGSIDTVALYVGDSGNAGQTGTVGQGGGGGGGRKGNGANGCGAGVVGPGGGSGGAGGCGGLAGGGAGAGGASIALISLNATITLIEVTLSASAAGNGGTGGDGQLGGNGGLGAPGGGNACTGGAGGPGGLGGAGGGGRGGPSIGLAYTGSLASISEDDIVVASAAAAGGPGGNGNAQANGGLEGVLAKTQAFD